MRTGNIGHRPDLSDALIGGGIVLMSAGLWQLSPWHVAVLLGAVALAVGVFSSQR